MNNVKVIMSCDDNPLYYEYWNQVSYVWKNLFDIDPVLIYISDEENKSLNEKNGQIIKIKTEKNIPKYLQGQLARIYYSSLFPDDICILSDIDIIPLNKEFFSKNKLLEKTVEDCFFHFNPVKREFNQLPMCYYSAYGKVFSKLFEGLSWTEFLNSVISYNFSTDFLGYTLPEHLKNNKFWFSDEMFLHTKIKEKNIKVNYNNKIISEKQRISRQEILNVNINNINNFIDCHMPRPFYLFEKQINFIILGNE